MLAPWPRDGAAPAAPVLDLGSTRLATAGAADHPPQSGGRDNRDSGSASPRFHAVEPLARGLARARLARGRRERGDGRHVENAETGAMLAVVENAETEAGGEETHIK